MIATSQHPPFSLVQPTEAICERSQLRYLAAGTGDDAILFVHGWSSFKEIWWSTLVALAPHARVFAIDLPGHGGSALLGCIRMAQIAERIADFCTAQGLRSVTLIGHSMGGNIALELALAHPELVCRLVLVNAAAQGHSMPVYTRSYLVPGHGWAMMRAAFLLAQRLSRFGLHVPHQHGGGFILPSFRRYHYLAKHNPELMYRLLDELFKNPIGTRAGAVRVPTLVVSGGLDPLVPARLSRKLAQAIPQARFVLLPFAGHTPMDDRPAEFERVLCEFLGYRVAGKI